MTPLDPATLVSSDASFELRLLTRDNEPRVLNVIRTVIRAVGSGTIVALTRLARDPVGAVNVRPIVTGIGPVWGIGVSHGIEWTSEALGVTAGHHHKQNDHDD